MCFSALASFSAAGVLTGAGVLALRATAGPQWRAWRPLALLPLGFAGQQILEGLLWRVLEQPTPAAAALLGGPRLATPVLGEPLAVAYLFFADALWPVWLPLAALALLGGRDVWRRRLARVAMGLGLALALLVWLPLLLQPERLEVSVVQGSIRYWSPPLLGGAATSWAGLGIYALVVAVPLLLVRQRRLQLWTLLLLLALLLSQLAWRHAFASVWCYFSALLALLIPWVETGGTPAPDPVQQGAMGGLQGG